MLNITKFTSVIADFGFLIKTIYLCDGNIVMIELLGIKSANTLFVLMPPDLPLSPNSKEEYEIIEVSKIDVISASEYTTYQSHLIKYSSSEIFKIGFRHENIFILNDIAFSSNASVGISNSLVLFMDFKYMCEDMTFLNKEMGALCEHIYEKIIEYINRMCEILFIQKDLSTILDRIYRYNDLYTRYKILYEKMSKKINETSEEFIKHKETVIEKILYIRDLRENLLLSTDILLCEIENNYSNIKHVSIRLKELF
jgi:hypothetical protein